ncbi:zinc finger protein 771-like [Bacillus rossius redtenbacheri]|uniref:zinc finger protein 771-like n=1 Tax=Bacillus rossius redtenbacheri TaxID=93214 RepID=UPI002FDDCEFB
MNVHFISNFELIRECGLLIWAIVHRRVDGAQILTLTCWHFVDLFGAWPDSEAPPTRRFQCPNCRSAYSRRSNLSRHVRYECGQEGRFKCPLCPHRSARHNNLQRHIHARHLAACLGAAP